MISVIKINYKLVQVINSNELCGRLKHIFLTDIIFA